MEEAPLHAGPAPQQQVSLWRKGARTASAEDHPPIPLGTDARGGPPTPRSPLVYHAFGAFGLDSHGRSRDDTLVLTEDDYLDYLSRPELSPHEVEGELVDNALPFLGFQLADWRSHLLFRLIMRLGGAGQLRRFSHVSVQIEPEMSSMIDTDGARRYLTRYFGSQANIEIY